MPWWLVAHVIFAVSEPPTAVTLRQTRTEAAQHCPDENWLKRNVVARLGYPVFVDSATLVATTRFDCTQTGCSADVELSHEGAPPRKRTLTSASTECRELAESLALTLALAIDPASVSRVEVQPAPLPQMQERVPAPPVSVPEKVPTFFQMQLGAVGSAGLSPLPTVGGRLGIGLRHSWFGLLVEARTDLSQSVPTEGGTVSTTMLLANVLPCGHLRNFGFCLAAGFGALRVVGNLPVSRRESGPLVLGGARISWEYRFLPWLGAIVHAGVQGIFTRITVIANDVPIWVTAQLTADAGLGVVTVF